MLSLTKLRDVTLLRLQCAVKCGFKDAIRSHAIEQDCRLHEGFQNLLHSFPFTIATYYTLEFYWYCRSSPTLAIKTIQCGTLSRATTTRSSLCSESLYTSKHSTCFGHIHQGSLEQFSNRSIIYNIFGQQSTTAAEKTNPSKQSTCTLKHHGEHCWSAIPGFDTVEGPTTVRQKIGMKRPKGDLQQSFPACGKTQEQRRHLRTRNSAK